MSNLRLFFIGQLASGFAFELFRNAIAFHILNVTGSPLQFSLAFISEYVAKMLLVQMAGFFVDRFNRKLIFVLVDVVQVFYLFLVLYLLERNGVSVNLLLLLNFFGAVFKSFTYPATKSIVPMIEAEARMKASSFEISNDKIARTLAPSVALLVFAKYGIKMSIALTILIYALSAISKSFLKIEKVELSKEGFSSTIATGLKSLFKNRLVVYAWLNAAVTQFVFHPFLSQVFTNLLRVRSEHTDLSPLLKVVVSFLGENKEDIYMSLTALLGLASSIGVFASLFFFQYYGKNMNWKLGMKITTAALLPCSIVVLAAIYFFSGKGDALMLTYLLFPINLIFYFVLNTYTVFFTFFYQEEIPKESMGRFIGNVMTIFFAVKALGSVLYGRMLEVGFIAPCVVLVAAALAKLFIFILFEREYDRKRL